eukprot:2559576-Pleurochrysis_carterae.AAC.1
MLIIPITHRNGATAVCVPAGARQQHALFGSASPEAAGATGAQRKAVTEAAQRVAAPLFGAVQCEVEGSSARFSLAGLWHSGGRDYSVIVAFVPPLLTGEERAAAQGAAWLPMREAARGVRGTPYAVAQEYAEAWLDARRAAPPGVRSGAVDATSTARDSLLADQRARCTVTADARATRDLRSAQRLLADEAELQPTRADALNAWSARIDHGMDAQAPEALCGLAYEPPGERASALPFAYARVQIPCTLPVRIPPYEPAWPPGVPLPPTAEN